jgi:alkylation response protein AidB-like acyl-CoA dehydrogenase
MDFQLSEEQELFRRSVTQFVDNEAVPIAARIDEESQFPTELFKKVGELGYFGVRYPEEYGGAGGDEVMFTLYCTTLLP